MLLLSLLVVLELGVEDRGDEGRGGPAADSGAGLGSDIVLVWRAVTNWRAALDEWAFIAGSDIYLQGDVVWSQIDQLLPLS